MEQLKSGRNIAVILNGPPGCGKDTIANLLVASGQFKSVKRQFKDALYRITAKYFNVGLDEYIDLASRRDTKDSIRPVGLQGFTPREALIHVSETIYKPQFGEDYFGVVEAESAELHLDAVGGGTVCIYPDGGFISELRPIAGVYDAVVLLRLFRPGFTFTGDSRNWVYPSCEEISYQKDVYLEDNCEEQDCIHIASIIEHVIQIENLK